MSNGCEITEELYDVIDAADACVIYQVDGELQGDDVNKLLIACRVLVRKMDGEGEA